jgi:hypothetical protein
MGKEEGMILDAEDPGEMGIEKMEKTPLHLEAIAIMKILLPLATRRITLRILVYFVPILSPGQGQGRIQGKPIRETPSMGTTMDRCS